MSVRLFCLAACWLVSCLPLVHAQAGEMHHHGHHSFPDDINAFHSALAPLWHSPSGPARRQNTCAAANTLAQLAKDIRSRDARTLAASVSQLKEQCQNTPETAETALAKVHDAFHALIEAPGKP